MLDNIEAITPLHLIILLSFVTERKYKMNIFQQIKSSISITEILSHYNVKKARGKNSYYCPLHENDGKKHKPSLIASDEKNTVKCMSQGCFDCDDIFSFIEKMDKCSKQEALQKAANLAGISIPKEKSSPTKKGNINLSQTVNLSCEKEQKRVSNIHDLQSIHIEWLAKRGIDTVTAMTFGLKAKGEFIAFPHIQNDEITGWKLRSIYDKTKTLQLGPEKGNIDLSAKLWGHHAYKGYNDSIRHAVIVEGEPDCLRLFQSCFDSSLLDFAVLTSTAGSNSVPKDLKTIPKIFPNLKRVSIIYDNDEPGKEGSQKIAKAFRKLGYSIHIYNFPPDKKKGYDITDFLQEGNPFSNIFTLPVEIITTYYDTRPAIESFDKAYVETETIKTGIKTFDHLTGGLQGLVILGGETGTGKTTFMLNIVHQAILQKHPVLYVSYELGYTELRVKLASMCSDYNYNDLCRDRKTFLKARQSLENNSAFDYLKIIDSTLLSNGNDCIQDGITSLRKQFPNSKIPLLVIDYLQGMPIAKGGEYRLSLASSVQKLRNLVRQQDIVILTASATNTQRSSNSSIHAGIFRETSEIEYSAYIAMVLGYKEEQKENGNVKPDQTRFPYLYVVKNRFGSKYTKGIPLEINWDKQTYSQKENE